MATNTICPLNGNACPGPEGCYPARTATESANIQRDESEAPLAATCPILAAIASLTTVAAALYPLLLGTDATEQETDKTPTVDERRQAVLDSITVDQDT